MISYDIPNLYCIPIYTTLSVILVSLESSAGVATSKLHFCLSLVRMSTSEPTTHSDHCWIHYMQLVSNCFKHACFPPGL
jgi:hypothetical protein